VIIDQMTEQVVTTPAARQAIAELCRQGTVMFVQSGGCCGGTAPMCFRLGEFMTGDSDLLLGEIDGCPYYIDQRLYLAWAGPAGTGGRNALRRALCRPPLGRPPLGRPPLGRPPLDSRGWAGHRWTAADGQATAGQR